MSTTNRTKIRQERNPKAAANTAATTEVKPSTFDTSRKHTVGQFLTFNHPDHAEAMRVIQRGRAQCGGEGYKPHQRRAQKNGRATLDQGLGARGGNGAGFNISVKYAHV